MPPREQMGTNINTSILARVAAGMRYAITGVGPDNWFGPHQPIAPVAQEQAAGRQFDYPVGINLRQQPRSTEEISFAMLRGLADGYDLMRLIIETRKDQIGAYEWEIVPKDEEADAATFKEQIKTATEFLAKPDRENDWPEWLRLMVEDLLVIDAICVYPRQNRGGKLHSLDLVDGATIKRLLDQDGRTPMLPSPAYQQVLKGITAVDYTTDDLIYMVRNKRTWKVYGYSPVEQVIMTVNIALRRQMHQLQYYTEGNIPEAIAQLPKDWPVQSVKDFQMWWDSLMEGNTAQRRKMKFIPNLEGILFPKADVLKDEYDEWLARICCFAFSISPTAFIKQNNRATSEQAADTAKEEGLVPLLTWLQTKMSALVQGPLGCSDLAFRWKIVNKVVPAEQAKIDIAYIGAKVITADEVRENLGMAPLTPEQKEELNPAPPEEPTGKIDPLTGLPYKEPVQPVPKGTAVKKGDVPGHEFHGNQYGSEGGVPDKLPAQNTGDAYRIPNIDLMRAILDKNGVKHSHISTGRSLLEQRKMLLSLLTAHDLIEKPTEKLAKAQRQVTKVGKYVEAHQPALQKAIAAVLTKRAKMIANALRHSKLLAKGDVPGHEFHGNQYTQSLIDTGLFHKDDPRYPPSPSGKQGGPYKITGTKGFTAEERISHATYQHNKLAANISGQAPVGKNKSDWMSRSKTQQIRSAKQDDKAQLAAWKDEIKAAKESIEKLAKAERQVTQVGRYVTTHQPALQAKIAAVLAKRAKMIANSMRHSKLLGKLAKADNNDQLVAQLIAELDASGVAAAVVDQVTPAMLKAFQEAGIKGVLQVNMDATLDIVNHMDEAALSYAEERSALLVKGIEDTTLEDLRTKLADGIERGLSASDLADSIEEMGTFGEARAALIARTELAFAHVQGNVEGWRQSGEVVGKQSILGDLHTIEDECDDAADAGIVGIDEDFVPGFDFPPYHPACICDVIPILSNSDEEV